MSWSRIQYTVDEVDRRGPARSLVTVPVHSIGLTQLEEMVQVSIDRLLVDEDARLVLAHSPLDMTRQVPLSSTP